MIRYKIQQFMQGRYGTDAFNLFLIILSVVLVMIVRCFGSRMFFVSLIAALPLYYSIFRSFSRNIEKRRAENNRFMSIVFMLKSKKKKGGQGAYKTTAASGRDKGYKYFSCPSCSTKLRVPKGRGKITVTCPKCRQSFKAKS